MFIFRKEHTCNHEYFRNTNVSESGIKWKKTAVKFLKSPFYSRRKKEGYFSFFKRSNSILQSVMLSVPKGFIYSRMDPILSKLWDQKMHSTAYSTKREKDT